MKKRIALIGIALITLGTTGCDLINNLHEVDEGKFYRTAQLDKKAWKKAIKKLNLRTIINLRGSKPGADWWEDEKYVSRLYGVEHYDINMSARRIPHRDDFRQLLTLLRDAPRPIMVHCQGGADRTGLASAVYAMEFMDKSRKDALWQLTPFTRHLWFYAPSKRYFIKEVYQGFDWGMNVYDPCASDQNYEYYNKANNCAHEGLSRVREEEAPTDFILKESDGIPLEKDGFVPHDS